MTKIALIRHPAVVGWRQPLLRPARPALGRCGQHGARSRRARVDPRGVDPYEPPLPLPPRRRGPGGRLGASTAQAPTLASWRWISAPGKGLAWDDIPGVDLDRWAADLVGFAAPGGESGAALDHAGDGSSGRMVTDLPGAQVVITHGGPLKVLLALAEGAAVDLARPTSTDRRHPLGRRVMTKEAAMFTLAELEEAQRAVHAVFPGTPHYDWPLLAARTWRRGLGQAREPHADRRLQGARRSHPYGAAGAGAA